MQNYSGTAQVFRVVCFTVKVSLLIDYLIVYIFGLQILHNFFSNHDKCPGTSDTSMLLVPENVKLNAEDDIKDLGMRRYFTIYTVCLLYCKVRLRVKLNCMS